MVVNVILVWYGWWCGCIEWLCW